MQTDNQSMPNNPTFGRRFTGLSAIGRQLFLEGAVLFACLLVAPANAQQGAPSVGTVYAERKPIAQTRDFVGRVEAIDRVVI